MEISLSAKDKQLLGVITARARDFDANDWSDIQAYCSAHSVELLMVRIGVQDMDTTQYFLSKGALLCETLLYYHRILPTRSLFSDIQGVALREMAAADREQAEVVADFIFGEIQTHYGCDPLLRDKDILAIQRGQLFDSNRPDDWERVFVVAEKKDQIIGLGVTDFSHELKRAFGVLRGVLPDRSVGGLGKAIVLDSMDRARKRGISKYQASCSIDNKITQIQMGQLGMRFSEAFYTLHLWL
tara:strand:+ start:1566 stop:2291 length:726 start_codon:yes stop_codon:yes gene_type:complete